MVSYSIELQFRVQIQSLNFEDSLQFLRVDQGRMQQLDFHKFTSFEFRD